jgi:hypothetical protein
MVDSGMSTLATTPSPASGYVSEVRSCTYRLSNGSAAEKCGTIFRRLPLQRMVECRHPFRRLECRHSFHRHSFHRHSFHRLMSTLISFTHVDTHFIDSNVDTHFIDSNVDTHFIDSNVDTHLIDFYISKPNDCPANLTKT